MTRPPFGGKVAPFDSVQGYSVVAGSPPLNWFITGASSKGWRDGDLNRLKSVPGKAFVVVRSQAGITTPC